MFYISYSSKRLMNALPQKWSRELVSPWPIRKRKRKSLCCRMEMMQVIYISVHAEAKNIENTVVEKNY